VPGSLGEAYACRVEQQLYGPRASSIHVTLAGTVMLMMIVCEGGSVGCMDRQDDQGLLCGDGVPPLAS